MSRITRFLILGMAMMLATPAFAANEPGEDSRHFGVRADFVLSTTTTRHDVVHWGPGTSVGIAYYAPFGRFTYFNVGLQMKYNTFGYSGDIGYITQSRVIDGHMEMIGLCLPIDIGFKIFNNRNVCLSLYTGPHFNFDFKFQSKYKYINLNIPVNGLEDTMYKTGGLDLAWGLGIAVDLWNHWHVHIGGDLGLSNMAHTNDIKNYRTPSHTVIYDGDLVLTYFKRAELSIGVGYNF